jgi:hypothetical protein
MKWILREKVYGALKDGYRAMRRPAPRSYPSRIADLTEGNRCLANALSSDRAFAAGRIGGVELNALERNLRKQGQSGRYSERLRHDMSNNAGFFPADDDSLDRFARVYSEAISVLDAVGVWFNHYEESVIKGFCPTASLIPLRALEPYYHSDPWSSVLRQRRVLVVHPFSKSIEASYSTSRPLLFSDPGVLPEFQLLTLKAVQSHAGGRHGFATWFDALSWMKDRISSIDFDIALIGAGAYGLPIAAHVKSLGKRAVHMGGAVQVMFGIIGRRWETHAVIGRMINEHWRRPLPDEVPPGAMSVEGGCYW